MPPQVNLQPGSTGSSVKQLQDWLVSNGYMTQAQVDTGYGTYGPQTTAAVEKLQSRLGVDSSTGPGYWGPRTIQAVSTAQPATIKNAQSDSTTSTGTSSTSTGGSGNVPPGITIQGGGGSGWKATYTSNGDGTWTYSDPYGRSQPNIQTSNLPSDAQSQVQAQIQASAKETAGIQAGTVGGNQLGLLGSVGSAYNQSVIAGKPLMSWDEALQKAAQDPSIVSKYADALKIDTAQFQQTISQSQNAANLESQQYKQKFEAERKALAEQSANAGQAYSGFRQKAEQNLGNNELSVVQSSRMALQKQLQDAVQGFESKYGSGAVPQASLTYNDPMFSSGVNISGLGQTGTDSNTLFTGSPLGGITGSQSYNQQQDVQSKATDIYNLNQAVS